VIQIEKCVTHLPDCSDEGYVDDNPVFLGGDILDYLPHPALRDKVLASYQRSLQDYRRV